MLRTPPASVSIWFIRLLLFCCYFLSEAFFCFVCSWYLHMYLWFFGVRCSVRTVFNFNVSKYPAF